MSIFTLEQPEPFPAIALQIFSSFLFPGRYSQARVLE